MGRDTRQNVQCNKISSSLASKHRRLAQIDEKLCVFARDFIRLRWRPTCVLYDTVNFLEKTRFSAIARFTLEAHKLCFRNNLLMRVSCV